MNIKNKDALNKKLVDKQVIYEDEYNCLMSLLNDNFKGDKDSLYDVLNFCRKEYEEQMEKICNLSRKLRKEAKNALNKKYWPVVYQWMGTSAYYRISCLVYNIQREAVQ